MHRAADVRAPGDLAVVVDGIRLLQPRLTERRGRMPHSEPGGSSEFSAVMTPFE